MIVSKASSASYPVHPCRPDLPPLLIPSDFPAGSEDLPVRTVSDFSLFTAKNPEKLVPLKAKGNELSVLRGLLVPLDGSKQNKREETGSLLILLFLFQTAETVRHEIALVWFL